MKSTILGQHSSLLIKVPNEQPMRSCWPSTAYPQALIYSYSIINPM